MFSNEICFYEKILSSPKKWNIEGNMRYTGIYTFRVLEKGTLFFKNLHLV